MRLLPFIALLVAGPALAQAPCQPTQLSARCQLERNRKADEDYRARIQKNMEELQKLQRQREEQERQRKADCLARLGKGGNPLLCQ